MPPRRRSPNGPRNRITEIRTVPASSLEPQPVNPNDHPDSQVSTLTAAVGRRGITTIPTVVERDGKLRLVDGHLRREVLGDAPIKVAVLDLTPAEELQEVIAQNQIARLAQVNPGAQLELVEAIEPEALESLGLTAEDVEALRLETAEDPPPLEDPGPQEPPKEPVTKAGDIWLVGPHRIACCDCREDHAIAALFGDERARMVWTDPPYGVDYAAKNEFLNALDKGNGIQTDIANDALDETGVGALIVEALRNACAFSVPGAACYAASPPGTLLPHFIEAFGASGFVYKHSLAWVKNNFVLGRCDYHYKHEVILYGWKPDAGHLWNGDHSQDSVFVVDKPHKSDLHPTMKPVELIAPMITNSSRQGEIVFDPFVGSGSTAIAAARTGRVCYCCDVAAQYVDVTVRRLAEAVKQPAILESTGERFPMPEEAVA